MGLRAQEGRGQEWFATRKLRVAARRSEHLSLPFPCLLGAHYAVGWRMSHPPVTKALCASHLLAHKPAVAKRLPSMATALAHRRPGAGSKTHILRGLLTKLAQPRPRTGGFESRWGYQNRRYFTRLFDTSEAPRNIRVTRNLVLSCYLYPTSRSKASAASASRSP